MKLSDRAFATVHAEPGQSPLWIGLMGPSGGGKTYSALRLAKGIQSVIGGKIEMIDTERGRGKHYAKMFDYEYTAFPPPHGSLDYQAAINHAVNVNKSSIVIIDSLSHEHEGEGGLIDFQEAEVERLAKGDAGKAERVKMLAWARPKAARKQLLRSMIDHGTSVVFILCFRAGESSKPGKDGKVIQMGFMPIAGKEFIYEVTVCALLMPGANGVPTWNPENVGEKMMRKLPEQFKALFSSSEGQPMSESHGKALAEWSLGGAQPTPHPKQAEKPPQTLAERAEAAQAFIRAAKSADSLEKRWTNAKPLCDELRDPVAQVDPHLYANLKSTYEECKAKFTPEDGSATDTEALVALSKRAKKFYVDKWQGDEAEAAQELGELTGGACKGFALLATYLADNPAFVSTLVNAIGGGE